MNCIHLGEKDGDFVRASTKERIAIYHCDEFGFCTLQDYKTKKGGKPLAVCEGCKTKQIPNQDEPILTREPVGTRLKEIIEECGVKQPPDCSCVTWMRKMDRWGIEGCQSHRQEIIDRLAEAASTEATWFDWLKIAAKGYRSIEALLNEAMKRSAFTS